MFPGDDYLFPLLLGVLGWYVASKLRVPVAGVLGPLFAIGLGAALGLPIADFPLWIKGGLQIVVGCYAGSRVTRATLAEVRRLGRPIALVTAWTVSSSMAIGYVASRLTSVDLATALLGSAPGGTAEMSAMALTAGANVPTVAIMHGFRLVATLGIVPFLARRRSRAALRTVGCVETTEVGAVEAEPTAKRAPTVVWLGTLGLGAAGGVLLILAGVPGGGVVGSLVAVAAAAIFTGNAGQPPVPVRAAAQLGVGVLVGSSLTPAALQLVWESLPVVASITTATLASGLVLSTFVESRVRGAGTALLACAPGGLTQMPLIADELGADLAQVTIFQLTRFIASIVLLPVLFRLLL
ncbi:MAG: AbrB family transcriptional regulator [Chloroflexota bacterium]